MSHSSFTEEIARRRAERNPLLAFNVVDLSSLLGVLEAAVAVGHPVILQFSARTVEFYGARVLQQCARASADRLGARCFVHLDHCRDDKIIQSCIDADFDGVMTDGSHLHISENIRWTSHWRTVTRNAGVALEAEYSAIRGAEDGMTGAEFGPTDFELDEYRGYCEATNPDLCGCDIGTSHGQYARAPQLDMRVLDSVTTKSLPGFVVHGASGLAPDVLRDLASRGVTKINFSTDLKHGWFAGLASAERSTAEPLAVLHQVRKSVQMVASSKWRSTFMVAS